MDIHPNHKSVNTLKKCDATLSFPHSTVHNIHFPGPYDYNEYLEEVSPDFDTNTEECVPSDESPLPPLKNWLKMKPP